MIFPQPIKESYQEGAYCLQEHFGTTNLTELYALCKNGTRDLAFVCEKEYGEDEYALRVDENGICVTCGEESGKFRAISSLRQLLHAHGARLPCCEIYDKPQFSRRGFMLDISRARIPKLATLKRLVDLMADLKYNELQLYMENFCFKFPHFPQVNEAFDCLTPKDVMELDAYCAERFIDLVPNQNCFGHMSCWLKHPDFAHLAVGDGKTWTGTLNILHPEAWGFVEKLFD